MPWSDVAGCRMTRASSHPLPEFNIEFNESHVCTSSETRNALSIRSRWRSPVGPNWADRRHYSENYTNSDRATRYAMSNRCTRQAGAYLIQFHFSQVPTANDLLRLTLLSSAAIIAVVHVAHEWGILAWHPADVNNCEDLSSNRAISNCQ